MKRTAGNSIEIKGRLIYLDHIDIIEVNKRRDIILIQFTNHQKVSIGGQLGDKSWETITEDDIKSINIALSKARVKDSFIYVEGLNGTYWIRKTEIKCLVPCIEEKEKDLTNILVNDETIPVKIDVKGIEELISYVNLYT